MDPMEGGVVVNDRHSYSRFDSCRYRDRY